MMIVSIWNSFNGCLPLQLRLYSRSDGLCLYQVILNRPLQCLFCLQWVFGCFAYVYTSLGELRPVALINLVYFANYFAYLIIRDRAQFLGLGCLTPSKSVCATSHHSWVSIKMRQVSQYFIPYWQLELLGQKFKKTETSGYLASIKVIITAR